MKLQKEIRILGFILLICSIVFMTYNFIKETDDDKTYLVYGLMMTVLGMYLGQYGTDTSKQDTSADD